MSKKRGFTQAEKNYFNQSVRDVITGFIDLNKQKKNASFDYEVIVERRDFLKKITKY